MHLPISGKDPARHVETVFQRLKDDTDSRTDLDPFRVHAVEGCARLGDEIPDEAHFRIFVEGDQDHVVAVSYTHLTLPTKA